MVFFIIGIFLLLMLGNTGKVIRYFAFRTMLLSVIYLSVPIVILIGCFYKD